MKPKLFIGSSVEGMKVANAIQQNLEHDCHPTIWSHGNFQLSSTALDDLIVAVNTFHFAVFVFTPDDILKIRDNQVSRKIFHIKLSQFQCFEEDSIAEVLPAESLKSHH
jgi:predicted nucleotide-binding protein